MMFEVPSLESISNQPVWQLVFELWLLMLCWMTIGVVGCRLLTTSRSRLLWGWLTFGGAALLLVLLMIPGRPRIQWFSAVSQPIVEVPVERILDTTKNHSPIPLDNEFDTGSEPVDRPAESSVEQGVEADVFSVDRTEPQLVQSTEPPPESQLDSPAPLLQFAPQDGTEHHSITTDALILVQRDIEPNDHDEAMVGAHNSAVPNHFDEVAIFTTPSDGSTPSQESQLMHQKVEDALSESSLAVWASAIEARVPIAVGFLCVVAGVVSIGWLILGRIRIFQLLRNTQSIPPDLLVTLQQELHIDGASLSILQSPQLSSAVAFGVLSPCIVVPEALVQQGDSPSLRAMVAHELAHLRQRDLWLLAIQRALLPLLALNPAYWWLRRQIMNEQELIADSVAAQGWEVEYASALLEWCRRPFFQQSQPRPLPALGYGDHSSLITRRIEMLLETPNTQSHLLSLRAKLGLGLVTTSLLILLATAPIGSLSTVSADDVPAEGRSASARNQDSSDLGDETSEEEEEEEEEHDDECESDEDDLDCNEVDDDVADTRQDVPARIDNDLGNDVKGSDSRTSDGRQDRQSDSGHNDDSVLEKKSLNNQSNTTAKRSAARSASNENSDLNTNSNNNPNRTNRSQPKQRTSKSDAGGDRVTPNVVDPDDLAPVEPAPVSIRKRSSAVPGKKSPAKRGNIGVSDEFDITVNDEHVTVTMTAQELRDWQDYLRTSGKSRRGGRKELPSELPNKVNVPEIELPAISELSLETQMELMRLEVHAAREQYELLSAELKVLLTAKDNGQIPQSEITRAQRELIPIKLALERSTLILKDLESKPNRDMAAAREKEERQMVERIHQAQEKTKQRQVDIRKAERAVALAEKRIERLQKGETNTPGFGNQLAFRQAELEEARERLEELRDEMELEQEMTPEGRLR